MAWSIEKVRPRIQWYRGRPHLVRYEWTWFHSAYGACGGVAPTRRQAARQLWQAQAEMLTE